MGAKVLVNLEHFEYDCSKNQFQLFPQRKEKKEEENSKFKK